MEEIYVRLYKMTKVEGKAKILLKDIASISGPPKLKSQIERICVLEPKEKKHRHYVVGIVDIIGLIHQIDKSISVQNLSEVDAIIYYNPIVPKKRPIWDWCKIGLVCIVVFTGTSTAIMAYQIDISLRDTFSSLYQIFTGEVTTNPVWLTVPYSIGMPLGILIFFNHFGSKKISEDPTPVEVEIHEYEIKVEASLIDTATATKRGQET